jgi:hypothetical protein
MGRGLADMDGRWDFLRQWVALWKTGLGLEWASLGGVDWEGASSWQM